MESRIRKKIQHFNIPGHAHELTFSCYQRMPLLSRDRSRQWLVKAMDDARRSLEYSLLCYVIMPEHVNAIIHPLQAQYDISRFLKRVKQSVSRKAKAWLLETNSAWLERLGVQHEDGETQFRFWHAGGGYDRNIADRKALFPMMEYIHNNPVRRGLARTAAEWTWSSAAWYQGGRDVPLAVDPVQL